MFGRDRSHDGRLLRRATGGLVVGVLVAAVASWQLELGDRLGLSAAQPRPPAVAPPLVLPAPAAASEVASQPAAADADPDAVGRALGALVTAPKLGPRVAVEVAEAGTGETVFSFGRSVVTPASTMKLLTCVAVLDALGPDHRFSTTVVRTGRAVTLVGGGDPLLTRTPQPAASYPRRADLTTLAGRTAQALRAAGVSSVRLGYDSSLFAGPSAAASWEPDYLPDNVVSPITSLWVDEGHERAGLSPRSDDPARAAAEFFASALRNKGIRVGAGPVATKPSPTATSVASVESPPLAQVVQRTLELSDNEAAEVLAHQVAVADGQPATFDGAARAVEQRLSDLGVALTGAVIHDGSGLSRADRLSTDTLLQTLRVASARPELRAVVTGLPVAGFSGSLAYRFHTTPRVALGEVRAKTGTLHGVSGLAGYVTTRDGVLLSFVAAADRIAPPDTVDARAKLDQVAGALAACVCSEPG